MKAHAIFEMLFILITAMASCSINPCLAIPYKPKPGDPERKAILDALRVPIEKRAKKNVIFYQVTIRVENDWAMVSAFNMYKSGKKETLNQMPTTALLRKKTGRWQVLDWNDCCDDISPIYDLVKEYPQAPRAIFGIPDKDFPPIKKAARERRRSGDQIKPFADLLKNYIFPKNALIVEIRPVRANRALILWMISPKKHPQINSDDFGSCDDKTRGSYYRGPTRVSLADTRTHKIINTIKIKRELANGGDTFDIPYRIHQGYYHFEGAPARGEGRPVLMFLKDYNRDGKALEFALYIADGCDSVNTTLIGYNERLDRVIQYPIYLVFETNGKHRVIVSHWINHTLDEKPDNLGYWKFKVNYRSDGIPLAKYEIRYNKRMERFEGEVTYKGGE